MEPTADAPGLEVSGFTVLGGLQVIAAEPGAELAGWSADDEGRGRTDGDEDAAPGLDVVPDVTPA